MYEPTLPPAPPRPPAPAWDPSMYQPPLPPTTPRRPKRRKLPWVAGIVAGLVAVFALVGYLNRDRISKEEAQNHTLSKLEEAALDKGLAKLTPETKASLCQTVASLGEAKTRQYYITSFSAIVAKDADGGDYSYLGAVAWDRIRAQLPC